MYCNIPVKVVIIQEMNDMCESKCKTEGHCEHAEDARGCALKHIAKAREMLAESRYEEADVLLRAAEDHLKDV